MPEGHRIEIAHTLTEREREQGTRGGHGHGEEILEIYVRDTVLFASVLFLIAVAQRFKLRGVRISANCVALALLAFTVFTVVALPRI